MFCPSSIAGTDRKANRVGPNASSAKTRTLPLCLALHDPIELVRFQLDDDGLHQMLGGRRGLRALGFEFFVEHALVGCMHIHQHQACAVLRDDVDAVELRERDTKWLIVVVICVFVCRCEGGGRSAVCCVVIRNPSQRLGDSPWTARFLAQVETAL